MAKTIHEMAEAYGREHQGTVDIEVFEAGANAVLKEIIDCFPNSFCINPDEVLGTVAGKLQELKEE